jgi:hypothetical protein
MQDCHFITYGDEKYAGAKQRIVRQANEMNIFNDITAYGPNNMAPDFVATHKNILQHWRGGGYWLWKPYFILKKLHEIHENDYLVYCDAGCNVNKYGKKRLNEYLNMVGVSEYGLLSFQMEHIEEHYTTSQIFNSCGVPPDSPIRKSGQNIGTILIMKKCDHVINLFTKCMQIIDSDHNLITDYYNNIDQIPEFIDNRHDQSILSVLVKIHGSVVISNETWFQDFNCPQAQLIPFLSTRQCNG